MALAILQGSDALPVELADVKNHLRVEHDEEDQMIRGHILAVADWLAGRQGWLGRSLLRQQLALMVQLPAVSGPFGPQVGCADVQMSGVTLPRPPVIEVESVEVIDSSRATTTIAADAWSTYDGTDGLTHLMFTSDFRWPVMATGPALLRITYAAGYGAAAKDLPASLRLAVMMAVARLYEQRGESTLGQLHEDPLIARLLSPYRVWS